VPEKADIDCGFSSALSQLTYPPKGKITIPGNPENDNYRRETAPPGYDPSICNFSNGTQTPAQVAFIINGTSQGSCFGNCATFESAYNYFLDAPCRCFNAYNIDVDRNNPFYSDDAFTAYLNIPAVKAAIHALTELPYMQCNSTLQAELTTHAQRSVPPAYFILPSLQAGGIKVHL
jgi:carboxypeptidase D